MKRMIASALVALVIAGITYAVGLKVATDRYKGSDCSDWVRRALGDAIIEGRAYRDADTSFNLEITVFNESIMTGVFYEGRNWGEPVLGRTARPAPHKICSNDYSGSSSWRKYRSPRAET